MTETVGGCLAVETSNLVGGMKNTILDIADKADKRPKRLIA